MEQLQDLTTKTGVNSKHNRTDSGALIDGCNHQVSDGSAEKEKQGSYPIRVPDLCVLLSFFPLLRNTINLIA